MDDNGNIISEPESEPNSPDSAELVKVEKDLTKQVDRYYERHTEKQRKEKSDCTDSLDSYDFVDAR